MAQRARAADPQRRARDGHAGARRRPGRAGPELDRPSPLGTMPVGVAVRDVRAHGARGDRLRRARTSTPSSPRRVAAAATAATRRPRRSGRARSRGCARRSRRRSDRRAAPARRDPRATGSTSSSSSCRWSGGDDPTGRLTLHAIAACCDAHLPAGDPIAGYAARLEDPALRSSVRGFLTGSIDLVLRLDGPRFAIVDYKTNWLGVAGEPLTAPALPARRARGRDAPRPLRAAGAALHGRAPPLPALAAARLRPRPPPRRRPLPVPARAWPAPTRRPSTGRGAVCSRGTPPGELVAALSDVLDRGRRDGATRRSVRRAARRARPAGCCGRSTRSGVLAAADVHVAVRLAALAGEKRRGGARSRSRSRCARRGSATCSSTSRRSADTASVESEEPVDLSALPWPSSGPWLARSAASPLVAVGEDGGPTGRPLRLLGSAALPRPLLARGAPGRRRPAGARRRGERALRGRRARRRPATAVPERRRPAPARCRGRCAVAAGSRWSPAARAPARRRPSRGSSRCSPSRPPRPGRRPAGRARRADRQGGGAPAGGGPRGDGAAAASTTRSGSCCSALRASTLHRLLGWRPGSHSRFRHDRGNRLPHDVVIVDETSMVSLSLMARLRRGRPPRRPADPRRRPRAARARSRPASCSATSSARPKTREVASAMGIVVLERVHRYGGGDRRARRGDPRAATATRTVAALARRAGRGDVAGRRTSCEADLELVRELDRGGGARGDGGAPAPAMGSTRWPRSAGSGCCARTGAVRTA